ncbi:hypothetical protein COL154_013491 [Colletotrichum chrysophilum]|uniref:Uncharacterized protein n=2 Tax=Colletotrichum chrysophilum TaxID=1836956 RepID=A0AAD9A1X1_9PEZI|nr:hypothetical protein COL154_013491 [Colletotrichum chrysophilum]KAK1839813.1 hypothetical protein CCHR01_17561 [Colletotrichum chrysophilum]
MEPASSMTDRHDDATARGVASCPWSPMRGASPISGSSAERQSPDEIQIHNLYDAGQPSDDDESRTLDFESESGSDHKETQMLDFKPEDPKSCQQVQPHHMSDDEKMEEIISLARRLVALGVPASIDGALLDEVDFLVDSASRVVYIVDEQEDQIHSSRSQSVEL